MLRRAADHSANIGLVEFAQLDLEAKLLALAQHDHWNRDVERCLSYDPRQVARLGDFLAVKSDHHIALLDASLVGRAASGHGSDQRTRGLRHFEACGQLRRHALNAHAEPTAPWVTVLAKLG